MNFYVVLQAYQKALWDLIAKVDMVVESYNELDNIQSRHIRLLLKERRNEHINMLKGSFLIFWVFLRGISSGRFTG